MTGHIDTLALSAISEVAEENRIIKIRGGLVIKHNQIAQMTALVR